MGIYHKTLPLGRHSYSTVWIETSPASIKSWSQALFTHPFCLWTALSTPPLQSQDFESQQEGIADCAAASTWVMVITSPSLYIAPCKLRPRPLPLSRTWHPLFFLVSPQLLSLRFLPLWLPSSCSVPLKAVCVVVIIWDVGVVVAAVVCHPPLFVAPHRFVFPISLLALQSFLFPLPWQIFGYAKWNRTSSPLWGSSDWRSHPVNQDYCYNLVRSIPFDQPVVIATVLVDFREEAGSCIAPTYSPAKN